MSNNNPEQLRLIGSLAGYDQGEQVQYPAPRQESAEVSERTLEAEAALGTLLMRQNVHADAIQESLPDLFDDVIPMEKPIPDNFVLGEE